MVGQEETTQFRNYPPASRSSPQNRSSPGTGSRCSVETPPVPEGKPPVRGGQPGTPRHGRVGRSGASTCFKAQGQRLPLLSRLPRMLRPLPKTRGVDEDRNFCHGTGDAWSRALPCGLVSPPSRLPCLPPPRCLTQKGAEKGWDKLGCPPSRRQRRLAAPRLSRLARVAPPGAGAGSRPLLAITIRYLGG